MVMIKERLLLPIPAKPSGKLLRQTQDASSTVGQIVLATAQKEKLSALIAGDEQAEPSRVNPLQLSDTRRSLPFSLMA